jgi:hypothetical protein
VWRFDDEIALSSATGVNFQRFRRVLKLIKLDVEMIKPVSGSDKRLQIGCECFFLLGLITYKVARKPRKQNRDSSPQPTWRTLDRGPDSWASSWAFFMEKREKK